MGVYLGRPMNMPEMINVERATGETIFINKLFEPCDAVSRCMLEKRRQLRNGYSAKRQFFAILMKIAGGS